MKPATKRFFGAVVDFFGWGELLDDAEVHDGDAVGEGHGLDLVVGDVDGGGGEFVLEVFELGAGGDAQLGVQVGEGLVHQEDLGLAHDGAGEGDALALAAGELAGFAVEELAELDALGGEVDAARPIRIWGRFGL